MTRFRKILAGLILGLIAPMAAAQPVQTPLAQALAADPDQAEALVAGRGAVMRDVLIWSQQRRGQGTPAQAARILAARPDWPGRERLRREAEGMLTAQTPRADVLALLSEDSPLTGRGALALARAYHDQPEQADAVIVAAWRALPLTEQEETAFLAAYAPLLAPHHVARCDALLAMGETQSARRMLARLPGDARALAEARLAYRSGGDVATAAQALTEAQRADPALLADRFAWLARQGRRDEAARLIVAQSARPGGLGDPQAWSGWRQRLVRDALARDQDMLAYDLASLHQLSTGAAFADLEWLAGYIALRRLDAPAVAQHHFQTLRDGVTTPISRARASYWLGRALAAQGADGAARAAYEDAAALPFTYYGRLALEEQGRAAPPVPVPAPGALGDVSQALLLLIDADERGAAYLFAEAVGARAQPPEMAALLAQLQARGAYFHMLRVAKGAAARGIVLPQGLFPLHPMADQALFDDPALVLAIARQESEFRTDAGSAAGALGIMQLLPGTARDMARARGMAYEQSRLTRDWGYNSLLGSAYLAQLRERYGDSPALIAAAYNAGPGRASDWIAALGDPRIGAVDPIDWVEQIPFSETRNYVMRVSEALPAYREQLGLPPRRLHDALRGTMPVPRPRARPMRDPVAPPPRPRARP